MLKFFTGSFALHFFSQQIGSAQREVYRAISMSPWSLKPIFGLLSDLVVMWKFRRSQDCAVTGHGNPTCANSFERSEPFSWKCFDIGSPPRTALAARHGLLFLRFWLSLEKSVLEFFSRALCLFGTIYHALSRACRWGNTNAVWRTVLPQGGRVLS